MFKRAFIVVSLTLTLIIGLQPLRAARGVLMTHEEVELLNALEASSAASPDLDSGTKGGNGFVRALKAPFKAIGRIFGLGKKDNNKIQRLSEKDMKKFETSRVQRTVDARHAAPKEISSDTKAALAAGSPDLPQLEANRALALENLEQGRALLNSGNLTDAISTLAVATALDPKLKEAHNLLGIAYEMKGFRDLALKSFELALRGDNDDPEHLNNMGYLLFKNGEYQAAVKYLKNAVKLAPGQQRYWNNLGLAQAQCGKFDDAYKSFAQAVGEFEGHMNIATRLQRIGYDKEAIKHLELARALRPNTQEILARLIELYGRTGKTEKAEEARSSLVTLRQVASAPIQ